MSQRVPIMGIGVDALTMEESVSRCLELIEERGHQHVVVNASKVIMAHDRPDIRNIISACPIVNADGQSIVWASRVLGMNLPERVAGIDLMNRLVDESARRGLGIYLLGARQEIVERVAHAFEAGGAEVVGYRNGYWSDEDEEEVVATIARTAPDILFVAMPSPKKELFLAQHLPKLNTGLAFGVGGSFDIVAGLTKRAPIGMQRLGLEWLYRLLQEPRRMLKRYVVGNSRFMFLLLRTKFRPNGAGLSVQD